MDVLGCLWAGGVVIDSSNLKLVCDNVSRCWFTWPDAQQDMVKGAERRGAGKIYFIKNIH